MACFGLSSSSSASLQTESRSCLQKPLTKVALFVISLLFAAAAVTSHFLGLGVPGIVGFSLGGGASIIALIIACFRSSALSAQKGGGDIASMSDQELVDLMVPRCELDVNNVDTQSKNQQVMETLALRIASRVYSEKEEEAIVRELEPIFSSALSSPDKFYELALMVIACRHSTPRFMATILEQLEWPSEEMKKQELPKLLGTSILSYCTCQKHVDINLGDPKNPTSFYAHQLVFRAEKIFGQGDFATYPLSLAQGIAYCIQIGAKMALSGLQKKKEQNTIDENTMIGVEILFEQTESLTHAMISPILPYLCHMRGLVSLKFGNVKMRDGDAEALLQVIKTNPHLVNFPMNVNGMRKKRVELISEHIRIFGERQKQPPTAEDLLSLPFVNRPF